jgi:hypothetical protein
MPNEEQKILFAAQLAWASERLRRAGVCPKLGFILWLIFGGHNRMTWPRRRMLGRKIRRGLLPKPCVPPRSELEPFIELHKKSKAEVDVD